ncbi:MAG: hypothetical protein C0498_12610 [Anaerolinea sp.]|nr:hypothetical protein [Anaerolinea sp.]
MSHARAHLGRLRGPGASRDAPSIKSWGSLGDAWRLTNSGDSAKLRTAVGIEVRVGRGQMPSGGSRSETHGV